MDKYEVYLSPKAKDMLDNHIYFLAHLSTDAAVKLKDAFIKELRSLETMPLRFPVLESEYVKSGKYRRMLVDKRYLVIYQVKDSGIFVDYIVDCRENYDWLLKQLT